MNHGIYIAAAGMKSRMQALEVSANNVANLNTIGYKRDRVFFNIFNRVNGTPVENALADSSVVDRTAFSLDVGPLERTGNPLDLALAEEGLFAVQTPQGVLFTRAGEFSLNSRREVVTAQGFTLLGERGPLALPPGGSIEIGQFGDVSVDGVRVDRIRVAHFADVNLLSKAGNSYFQSADPAAEVRPERLTVKQGYLERANVIPGTGLADSIRNMRSYEMLARALRSLSRDVNQRVINEVGQV